MPDDAPVTSAVLSELSVMGGIIGLPFWCHARASRFIRLLAPLAAMFAGLPPSSSELRDRKALCRHLLLQIGGANFENPPPLCGGVRFRRLQDALGLCQTSPGASGVARRVVDSL